MTGKKPYKNTLVLSVKTSILVALAEIVHATSVNDGSELNYLVHLSQEANNNGYFRERLDGILEYLNDEFSLNLYVADAEEEKKTDECQPDPTPVEDPVPTEKTITENVDFVPQ